MKIARPILVRNAQCWTTSFDNCTAEIDVFLKVGISKLKHFLLGLVLGQLGDWQLRSSRPMKKSEVKKICKAKKICSKILSL